MSVILTYFFVIGKPLTAEGRTPGAFFIPEDRPRRADRQSKITIADFPGSRLPINGNRKDNQHKEWRVDAWG
jgi:hypothetical protein